MRPPLPRDYSAYRRQCERALALAAGLAIFDWELDG